VTFVDSVREAGQETNLLLGVGCVLCIIIACRLCLLPVSATHTSHQSPDISSLYSLQRHVFSHVSLPSRCMWPPASVALSLSWCTDLFN